VLLASSVTAGSSCSLTVELSKRIFMSLALSAPVSYREALLTAVSSLYDAFPSDTASLTASEGMAPAVGPLPVHDAYLHTSSCGTYVRRLCSDPRWMPSLRG
jgi:hypothetical protein